MKYKIFFLKLLLIFFYILPVKANFDIKAKTAILQDYHSGQILFEKYTNEKIYHLDLNLLFELNQMQ